MGAGYNFLSDPDGKVLDLFNIRHHQPNPGGKDIALPTMILTDKAGIIRWVHKAEDYRVRIKPDQILKFIDHETL
jgi:peroxiredoxin